MHRRFFNALKPNGSNHESDKSNGNSLTASSASEQSDDDEGFGIHLDEGPLEIPDPIDDDPIDNTELAALVAQYGHGPSTAWLERARYRIWRPSDPVLSSSFLPIQGYLHAKHHVFAWGSPLASDQAALKPTLTQFIAWAKFHNLHVVYCCVPKEVEELLANVGWSTIQCINEDVIDPQHVLEITREDDGGGHGSGVKDLKKNIRRAERANIEIRHISRQDLSDDLKHEIEDGVDAWKRARNGRWQLAASSFDPWLDFENREYWVAFQRGEVIGVLILTPAGDSYVIKNVAQFPNAPKGTSERLIHTVLRDLHQQHPERVADHIPHHLTITFNISAANDLEPYKNISIWKIEWLNQTYKWITRAARLMNRHDFRRKFDTSSGQMFVCYPSEDGFGKDGTEELLRLLRR